MKKMICILAFTVGAVFVQAEPTAYFKKHDTNGDGKIDKPEYYEVVKGQLIKEGTEFSVQVAEQRFFNRDGDQNGWLDDGEVSFKPEFNKKWGYFKNTDTNNDGFVSKEEFSALTKKQLAKDGKTDFQAEADKRFKKRDADADGKLSAQEFFSIPPQESPSA